MVVFFVTAITWHYFLLKGRFAAVVAFQKNSGYANLNDRLQSCYKNKTDLDAEVMHRYVRHAIHTATEWHIPSISSQNAECWESSKNKIEATVGANYYQWRKWYHQETCAAAHWHRVRKSSFQGNREFGTYSKALLLDPHFGIFWIDPCPKK